MERHWPSSSQCFKCLPRQQCTALVTREYRLICPVIDSFIFRNPVSFRVIPLLTPRPSMPECNFKFSDPDVCAPRTYPVQVSHLHCKTKFKDCPLHQFHPVWLIIDSLHRSLHSSEDALCAWVYSCLPSSQICFLAFFVLHNCPFRDIVSQRLGI